MQKLSNYKWPAVFLLILGLTQSNLIIEYSTQPSFLGLPQWIWWFISFHILFVIALYCYVQESDET